jgi:RHS repeat-associated protein
VKRALCSLLILASFVSYAASQVATGILPFNSYGGGPFDSVNLGNLNVHFSIPVLHKAGRGTPFTYDLNYDSSIYRAVVSNGTTQWQPVTNIGNIASYWGWQGLGPVYSPYVTYKMTFDSGMCGQFGNQPWSKYSYSNFTYYDESGTAHAFNVGGVYYTSPGPPNCPPSGAQPPGVEMVTAQDGSGYLMSYSIGASSGSIQSKNGTTISVPWGTSPPSGFSPYSSVDRNGNTIGFNNGTYTDTLGQAVLIAVGSAPNPVTFSYVPPAGEASSTRVAVRVNFVNYTVQTNFNALDGSGHAIAEYHATSAVALVDNVTFPDGTQYKFNYEATPSIPAIGACTPLPGTTCTSGRLLKVTLPTGGTITYGYTGGGVGVNGIISDGSAAGLTRQLSSPGGMWSYTRSQVSGHYWTTSVAAPTGDNTTISFTQDSASGNGATYSFYETQRQTSLLATTTCWNGVTAACNTTPVSSPITEKAVTMQYANNGQQSKIDTTFTGTGLATNIKEYAYSTGAPTTLLRQTSIFYGNYFTNQFGEGCTAMGNNIVDKACEVVVYDGSNNVLSKAIYNYDEYSTYPLQPTTGTPQHGSISGSRGNLTSVSTAISWNPSTHAVSSWLTRHFKYYDTGNVYQSQDVNTQWTTHNYSTAVQGNTTKSCGNSFSTSYTLPISGLSSSASTTYDCIGGVVTNATDVNGSTSTTSYTDTNFWRPDSVVAPYTSNTNTTTTSFTYSPTSLDSRMLFNSGTSVLEQLTTFGTFGQALYSQQREGPTSSNWDSTQALYDSLLRPFQSTMPCMATSGNGCPTSGKTTSTFDALGRVTQTTNGGNPTPGWVKYTYTQNDVLQELGPAPAGENSKQKQLEYDALGRLVSVCEKTNGPGYGVCSQSTSSPNGYLTTYTYGTTAINSLLYTTLTVTQNAQAASGSRQTRVYTYDLLGRLVSEQNPENGTTSYTYDSDSAGNCSGTYTGNLVKLTDAKGNKICYQYDAIHRNTQITYPSGPDAANTPSKTFVYDSATYNGTPMANPKGRLVEAYTGASASKNTDEFFSYSVRGELLDTWQCTPHSGTNGCASVSNYYHVTAGFFENGALKSLSSSISGLPSQTYGVDPMGRPNTVTASTGQNPVTGTTFDLANFKTTVTYGSTDSDVVTLDPNTGRMTQYKSNVGSQNVTGNLTWNANGSLGTLAITDQLNSLDTQTCNYTHDDLSRISSVGCLNGSTHRWDNQYTYDAFGNITKTVPLNGTGFSFQPTYDTSKNWITALPGITTTTDPNGQMTYDGAHNYTWDAEGKMHMLDTATLTYDALGRMVEKAVSSTYTPIVYGPQGRFASMNGQTLVSAFIPAPGAQVVYTNASLNTTNKIAYYRHADQLGSSRLATTPTRTLYSSTAYAPFGEPYSQSGTPDLSFTGQEQDTVSGIYDFPARNYPVNQGRWVAPDPAGLGAANPGNPQSWNRYAYVLNNPTSNVDPLGLDCSQLVGNDGAWVGGCDPGTPSGVWTGTHYGPGCSGGWCPGSGGGATWSDPNPSELGIAAQYWGRIMSGHGDPAAPMPMYDYVGLIGGGLWACASAENGDSMSCGFLPATANGTTVRVPAGGQTLGQILAQGKAFAKKLLKNPKCDRAFGGEGVGARRLGVTQYTFKGASAYPQYSNWVGVTTGWNTVDLSTQLFGTNNSFGGQNGTTLGFSSVIGSAAFTLLHELAHEMDDITGALDDSTSNANEERNNQWVYDKCFAP